MTQFAAQLKNEMSRIAKKELRAETVVVKKANAQHRADMAELKRRVASLEAALKRLSKAQSKVQSKADKAPAAGEDTGALRFRADGFASLRKKLGLSGMQMAQLLGVSNQSVYHWESGKSRPRAAQLATIAAVRKWGKKQVAARLQGQHEGSTPD
jgi:DNA-binding transcriptional regulator YiaG